jgi:hypothetical protein
VVLCSRHPVLPNIEGRRHHFRRTHFIDDVREIASDVTGVAIAFVFIVDRLCSVGGIYSGSIVVAGRNNFEQVLKQNLILTKSHFLF